MIHYSCDLCGKRIRDERFTVKVEVAAATDPEHLTDADLEEDHLQQIAAELSLLDSTAEFTIPETGPKEFAFDLCSGCCQTYMKSPLGRAPVARPNFSHN